MSRGGLTILLVEDNDHDIFFVKRATQKIGPSHRVFAVHNGEQAIRYLQGEGPHRDRQKFPLPNLILSDLKMPRMDGLEFLKWLRGQAAWAIIPIIILSGSGLDVDVREAYSLGANSYFTKPSDHSKLVKILTHVCEYWAEAQLPFEANLP